MGGGYSGRSGGGRARDQDPTEVKLDGGWGAVLPLRTYGLSPKRL